MSFHMSWRTTDEDGQPGIAQIKPCRGCGALVANLERCRRCMLEGEPGELAGVDYQAARARLIGWMITVGIVCVVAVVLVLKLAWRLDELERLARDPHTEQAR